MRRFILSVWAVTLLLGSSVEAEQETLKVETVLESVRNFHPLYSATQESVVQSEAEILAANSQFDTYVSAGVSNYAIGKYDGLVFDSEVSQVLPGTGVRVFSGYRNTSGSIPFYDDDLFTGEGGELRAGVKIPLLRDRSIDKARGELLKASFQRAVANTRVEERRIELTRGATASYWIWAANGERLRVAEKLLKVAKERDRQLSQRVTSGDLAKFDADDNARIILQREIAVRTAQRALQKSTFDLSLFFRDASGKPILVPREKLPANLERPTTSALDLSKSTGERRPELRRIEIELERNRVDLDLSENLRLPLVDLTVGATNDLGRSDTVSEEGELKVGLRFQLPIQNSEARGRQQFSLSKERELRFSKRFLGERIANEIRDSEVALNIASEKYALAVREQQLSERLQTGEEARFGLGDSNLIFVNLREQTAAEAAIRVVDALAEWHIAVADYRAATAQVLDTTDPDHSQKSGK